MARALLCMRDAAARAVARARAGEGPYILEVKTYRYRGHSMSDPAKYRTKDEVSKMRDEHDPIEMVRKRLLELHAVPEGDIKATDAKVREVVNSAAEFATSTAYLYSTYEDECEAQPTGLRVVNSDVIQPDRGALRDDLAHVAEVLSAASDTTAIDYIARFLAGVARSAHDPALEAAATALARDYNAGHALATDLARISGMVQDRLSRVAEM